GEPARRARGRGAEPVPRFGEPHPRRRDGAPFRVHRRAGAGGGGPRLRLPRGRAPLGPRLARAGLGGDAPPPAGLRRPCRDGGSGGGGRKAFAEGAERGRALRHRRGGAFASGGVARPPRLAGTAGAARHPSAGRRREPRAGLAPRHRALAPVRGRPGRIPARRQRNGPDLRARRLGSSRAGSAAVQPGIGGERRARAVDSRGEPGREPFRRADRAGVHPARPHPLEHRAQGAPVRGTRRAGPGRRRRAGGAHPPHRHLAIARRGV
ncbi:MAG: hypothetical protein AVDCRST_MAG04-4055, partial [uncultured Acetobacteraceae bacterium]